MWKYSANRILISLVILVMAEKTNDIKDDNKIIDESKVVLNIQAEENGEDLEKRKADYEKAQHEYERGIEKINAFGKELKDLFQKSQDNFEKQLTYISAGALGLSVGFIKDIVTPIKNSGYKWMLLTGWALLIFTLLLNLFSNLLAGDYAKIGAKETEDIEKTYDPAKIDRRSKRVETINWITLATLAFGIVLIVLYITLNAIYD